jgi:DNA-directed RNA polymerase specialized sigma24 family protein
MSAAQTSLGDYEADLSVLSEAEREAYEAVVLGDTGAREFARDTDRAPGTVGNLLRRARRRLDGEGVSDTW